MTWDDQKLYLAVSGANVAEASIVYLSGPLAPSDAGADASDDGSTDAAADAGADAGTDAGADAGMPVGYAYDGTKLAHIGFAPKLVVYAKSTYNEYRTTDSTGSWSAAQSGTIQVCVGGGTTREFAIPWTYVATARPPSFAWVSYLTSAAGFAYGALPSDNPAGAIGTSAAYPWFYDVRDATVITPFANKQSN
jgi:hypothetical protein